jgi:hypothetical protein
LSRASLKLCEAAFPNRENPIIGEMRECHFVINRRLYNTKAVRLLADPDRQERKNSNRLVITYEPIVATGSVVDTARASFGRRRKTSRDDFAGCLVE